MSQVWRGNIVFLIGRLAWHFTPRGLRHVGKLSFLGFLLCSAVGTAAESIDFSHDILPVLKQRCAKCHSNGTYKGGFSMDHRDALLASGAVDLATPQESELLRRIRSKDEEERMPPEGPPLTDAEVARLDQWIVEKVTWEPGFSFKAQSYIARLEPRRPELPEGFVGNPIDFWVMQYQREQQIESRASVADEVFLRRVYLDLVGLLPTLEEQDEFFAWPAETRREKLIGRLLDDEQRYAEHWLTFWNDHLRNDYRGTGFIDGGRRQITGWLYKALKENMPYDQFVRELISPTDASSGFIKGIKWRGRVNASQVPALQFAQNTAQVFLGINLKCASCHDSFIDDWKLTDAYGLAAVLSDEPLEIHRCDKPTGALAQAKFVFPELGEIDSSLPSSERLQQMARLMTHEKNGRFSRTIVNRLWQRLMGRGIVYPVDVMGNPPWSEDLLDWLASDFVEHGYDLKHTLRVIAQSRAYQASTVWPSDDGPSDNRFEGPVLKRMTAEQFSDAIWDITKTHPQKTAVDFGDRKGPVRASLVESDPLMRSLGRPNREQVVTMRPEQLTTLQALDLSNGAVVADTLSRGAAACVGRDDFDSEQFIEQLFRRALTRLPSTQEREIAREMLEGGATAEQIADLVWAVVMLPDFQTIK